MKNTDCGQALIMLLFFMTVAITITTAAVIIILTNSLGSNTYSQAQSTYAVAESGAENAIMQLLRNPNYTGETLPVGMGVATVQVTGTGTKTVISTGSLSGMIRKIQLSVSVSNNIATVNSWKEVW